MNILYVVVAVAALAPKSPPFSVLQWRLAQPAERRLGRIYLVQNRKAGPMFSSNWFMTPPPSATIQLTAQATL